MVLLSYIEEILIDLFKSILSRLTNKRILSSKFDRLTIQPFVRLRRCSKSMRHKMSNETILTYLAQVFRIYAFNLNQSNVDIDMLLEYYCIKYAPFRTMLDPSDMIEIAVKTDDIHAMHNIISFFEKDYGKYNGITTVFPMEYIPMMILNRSRRLFYFLSSGNIKGNIKEGSKQERKQQKKQQKKQGSWNKQLELFLAVCNRKNEYLGPRYMIMYAVWNNIINYNTLTNPWISQLCAMDHLEMILASNDTTTNIFESFQQALKLDYSATEKLIFKYDRFDLIEYIEDWFKKYKILHLHCPKLIKYYLSKLPESNSLIINHLFKQIKSYSRYDSFNVEVFNILFEFMKDFKGSIVEIEDYKYHSCDNFPYCPSCFRQVVLNTAQKSLSKLLNWLLTLMSSMFGEKIKNSLWSSFIILTITHMLPNK